MDLLSSTVRSHSADAQEWEDQEDVEWSLGWRVKDPYMFG